MPSRSMGGGVGLVEVAQGMASRSDPMPCGVFYGDSSPSIFAVPWCGCVPAESYLRSVKIGKPDSYKVTDK
jgi:hypothetical protein